MNLENFTEEEINKARKQLDNLSMISHFAGEFSLVGGLFVAGMVPLIKDIIGDSEEIFNVSAFGYSIAIYGLSQILMIQLRGIGNSREDNIDAINHYSELSKKEEIRGNKISSWVSKKFAETHQGFLDNQEKYDKWFKKYMELKYRK